MLQLPAASQVGVIRVSAGQDVSPQTVPAGCEPAVAQTAVPVSHEMAPTRHGLERVQGSPAVHELH